jgi:uncharacterized protein (DUF2126 family)
MIADIAKRTGIDPKKVSELIAYAQKAEDIDVTKKVPDPEPQDDGDDEPEDRDDDDAMARKADMMARGK